MDRHRPLMALAALIMLALGAQTCESPKLGDPINPPGKYLGRFVGNGAAAIQIYDSPAHYFWQALDPASVNNATVTLERASDGANVSGDASGFDIVSCLSGGTFGCPRGISFRPGGLLDPCDLDGDTAYNLIIDGVVLNDGSSLAPITITFRTLAAPPGYTPNYCSATPALSWWTIEDINATNGLNGGIAADAVTTYLFGVIDSSTLGGNYYYGYDAVNLSALHFGQVTGDSYTCLSSTGGGPNNFPYPPYITVLKIANLTASDYDLSTSLETIQIVDINNNVMDAVLPGDTIPAGQTLLLYVANDGSTYYMYDSTVSPGDHTLDVANPPECGWDCCQDIGLGCPTMDPPTAFALPPAATGP